MGFELRSACETFDLFSYVWIAFPFGLLVARALYAVRGQPLIALDLSA
jgi:hypothetical protein